MQVVSSGFAEGLWPSQVGPVDVHTSNIAPKAVVVDEIPPIHGGEWSVLPSQMNPRIVPSKPGAPIQLVDFSGLLERAAHFTLVSNTKAYGPMAKTVFRNDAMLGLALDTYA
jgi:hypothetical protein